MISIDLTSTIGEAFARAADAYGQRPFLAAPIGSHRSYHPGGYEIDYRSAAREVRQLCALYANRGFGHGHRVGLLLDNRPEHFLHKLALNTLGASCVPINPDYRADEIAYLLEHSEADLVVVSAERRDQLNAGVNASNYKPPVSLFEAPDTLPVAARQRLDVPVSASTEASVLYTSGTTGRPKGCMLSHGYELESGAWYATRGALATFRPEGERLYNPLPVYHVNSSIMSFQCMMLTGGCQIQADRFNPTRWWDEVRQTRATVVHYLGIIVPMLLGMKPSERDRNHEVRFAIGAGAEPQLHDIFEQRFGFPLIEVWGMTEMVRVIIDNVAPRQVGTRAFGRPTPGIEVRIVDDNDATVPTGNAGEMVIRHSEETPRRGFFSGYLKDEESTKTAWRNGWFHTGDAVRQGPDGMLYFHDRKKNIIRRSGENIAAAEVEAILQTHPLVKQVAVLAVNDDLREEEVFACVVLHDGAADLQQASNQLFEHCFTKLAYYKAPGWIRFLDQLPTTGTQKIKKHEIFPAGSTLQPTPGTFDMRSLKKRDRSP